MYSSNGLKLGMLLIDSKLEGKTQCGTGKAI